jgi:hypothetical protein
MSSSWHESQFCVVVFQLELEMRERSQYVYGGGHYDVHSGFTR